MMAAKINYQDYPRIRDEKNPLDGCLDDAALSAHSLTIPRQKMEKIIREAIQYAAGKSGRVIFEIPLTATDEEIRNIHEKAGRELFKYFLKYCGDPAATAYACLGKSYRVVAKEHFRNRTLQKERMNSGWRYQHIAKLGAIASKRFLSVSDIGTAEADFNVEIATSGRDVHPDKVTIYVSVKNRVNTMGGQDWPKAIDALERVAATDKNRNSPYLCVFGIANEEQRTIKCHQNTGKPYSVNTEVWPLDFFWPFFVNYSYGELIQLVLDVIMNLGDKDEIDYEVPETLLKAFGKKCREHHLLDENGCFADAYALLSLFIGEEE